MRPKMVILILLFSVAGLLAILFARPSRDKSQTASPDAKAAPPTIPAPETTTVIRANNSPAQPAISQIDHAFSPETHEDYVARRVAELMDLAMTDDNSSLYSILSELNNRDPQIREAAVTATVQFKSPEAIPALQGAYARTDDPEEKIRIANAMDFLAIPIGSQTVGQSN